MKYRIDRYRLGDTSPEGFCRGETIAEFEAETRHDAEIDHLEPLGLWLDDDEKWDVDLKDLSRYLILGSREEGVQYHLCIERSPKVVGAPSLDLVSFKDAAERVRNREGSSEFQLNLACWLGERSYLLIEEIERLRKESGQ